MKTGVSTACLFPMQMEKALRELGEQGISLAECFFNTPSELKKESLRPLKGIADTYGMKIQAVHPFTTEMESFFFFTDYPGRLEDGLEVYRRFFETAAYLGAPYVIIHGEHRLPHPMDDEAAFWRINTLREEGLKHGITLLHENVSRCRGGDPEYLARLHLAIPEQRFVLDCKQALRAGHSAMDFVDALGSAIVHIHASDSAGNRDCLPIGEGTFDFQSLFAQLRRKGADFSAVLELYRNNFNSVEDLTKSCIKLQETLDFVENYWA